jgi:hypothetical protein
MRIRMLAAAQRPVQGVVILHPCSLLACARLGYLFLSGLQALAQRASLIYFSPRWLECSLQ